MSDKILYTVSVWTKPVDWAASPQKEIVGYHKTRAGAEARIEELKKHKEYGVYWGDLQINCWPLNE